MYNYYKFELLDTTYYINMTINLYVITQNIFENLDAHL